MQIQPMSATLEFLLLHNEAGEWIAVIEASQGTRHEFKHKAEWKAFVMSGVLPPGLAFPHDFGFRPSTRGDDGDALDVLVRADEALPPGTVVTRRIVGLMKAEQQDKGGRPERNDRVIAVAQPSHRYGEGKELQDVAARAVSP